MVRVGYALKEKRIKSFITPSLIEFGNEHNVTFHRIDYEKPLANQGPFDLILYKLIGDEWSKQLEEYSKIHPETKIVDDYNSIRRLDNRVEMLKVISGLDLDTLQVDIQIPNQIQIDADVHPELVPKLCDDGNINLPVIAKPLSGINNPNAHSLSLVLFRQALSHLQPPIVVQEFVNHGGALFKLYVLGDQVMVFKRNSLPDIPPLDELELKSTETIETQDSHDSESKQSHSLEEIIHKGAGLVEFSQISNAHLSEAELSANHVEDPPTEFIQDLARQLRHSLGTECFNVDILRENGNGNRYYVVDINYLPGYERLPDFEPLFIGFILTSIKRHRSTLPPPILAETQTVIDESLPPPFFETKSLSIPYPPAPKKKHWVSVRAVAYMAGLRHHAP